MTDIRVTKSGDIDVSELGDIYLTDSVVQAVLIRLRWIYREWRLGPQYGFPWFEEVLVKNPNIPKLRTFFTNEIRHVYGVTDATVDNITYNSKERTATVKFTIYVNEQTYREEVSFNA